MLPLPVVPISCSTVKATPIIAGVASRIGLWKESKTTEEHKYAILTEIICMPLEIISSTFSHPQTVRLPEALRCKPLSNSCQMLWLYRIGLMRIRCSIAILFGHRLNTSQIPRHHSVKSKQIALDLQLRHCSRPLTVSDMG